MTFTVTLINDGLPDFVGKDKVVKGTFANTTGTTGGEVSTGLRRVETFFVQQTGGTTGSSNITVNETLPLAGGDVSIVCDINTNAVWEARGD